MPRPSLTSVAPSIADPLLAAATAAVTGQPVERLALTSYPEDPIEQETE